MICIVSRPDGKGSGAEMVLIYLLHNIPDKKNIIIVTPPGSSVYEAAVANKIKVVPVDFEAEKLWVNIKRVLGVLKQLSNVKKIHAWQAKSFEVAYFISIIKRIPLTCTLHDHPLTEIYTERKKKLIRFISNRSEVSCAVSNALKEECKKNSYHSTIQIVHNGLPSLQIVRTSSEKIRIGFMGMYADWKGFTVISDWITRTDKVKTEWKLYGDITEQNKRILEKLSATGADHFFYYGHKRSELIFSEIDILIVPSVQFDPYPTVLLEASRAGVPVIASNNGGAVEIVVHGETGYLFNTGNADEGLHLLQALIADDKLYQKLSGESINQFRKNYTIQEMAESYSELWGIRK